MPLLGQIGNLLTVLIAFIGGLLILNGSTALTAGIVVAFLSLSKSFANPIQPGGPADQSDYHGHGGRKTNLHSAG